MIQHVGVHCKGPGDADALLHAAAHLVRVVALPAVQPNRLDGLRRRLVARRPVHALDLEAEGHVVQHAPVRQQPIVLEDHRNFPTAEFGEFLRTIGEDVVAVKADLACVGSTSRIRHRARVDLPLPERPITTKVSPASTLNDTSRRATTAPSSSCISSLVLVTLSGSNT